MVENPNSSNSKLSGTVAWQNLRDHFDSSSRATLTMLLHKFLSSPHSRSDTELDKWLGNVMQQFERLINIKDINLNNVLIAAYLNSGHVFKNSLLKAQQEREERSTATCSSSSA